MKKLFSKGTPLMIAMGLRTRVIDGEIAVEKVDVVGADHEIVVVWQKLIEVHLVRVRGKPRECPS